MAGIDAETEELNRTSKDASDGEFVAESKNCVGEFNTTQVKVDEVKHNNLEKVCVPGSNSDNQQSPDNKEMVVKQDIMKKTDMCGTLIANKENLPKGDPKKSSVSDEVGDVQEWNSSEKFKRSFPPEPISVIAKNPFGCKLKNDEIREVGSNSSEKETTSTLQHTVSNGFEPNTCDFYHRERHNGHEHTTDRSLLNNISVGMSHSVSTFLNSSKEPKKRRRSDSLDCDNDKLMYDHPAESSAFSEIPKDLMKFAEVLYKCTLCTSIPSILTSKSSFLQHVKEQHLVKKQCVHVCKFCDLNFQTEEDLKEHTMNLHPVGNDISNQCEQAVDHDLDTHAEHLAENDSDSDSSGHKQLKTKVTKRLKPLQDFEEPKQLVDHAGIETSDGSLDLSRKDVKETITHSEKQNGCVKVNHHVAHTEKIKNEVNLINVQQITDQILKSNAHHQNLSTSSCGPRLSFTPSFTPEFGKYTKLVREGGNIVYFCQVCNWKSPVKSAFHAHCSLSSHTSKVASAEDPDSVSDISEISNQKEAHLQSSTATTCPSISVTPNLSTPRDAQLCWPLSFERSSSLADSALFYNYVRQRPFLQGKKRTPVVSQFSSLAENLSSTELLSRLSEEHQKESLGKKRKKGALPTVKNVVHHRNTNSESDSDESKSSFQELSDYNQLWNSHTSNMAILRNKLFRAGHLSVDKSGERSANPVNESLDLSVVKRERDREHGETKEFTAKKRKCDSATVNEDNPTGVSSSATSIAAAEERRKNFANSDESKKSKLEMGSLFKLYQCHACSFEYSNIEEYESHFERVHKTMGGGTVANRILSSSAGTGADSGAGNAGTTSKSEGSKAKLAMDAQSFEVGENWRVQKLKDILPQFLLVNDKANTSRDYLLQCISLATGHTDAPLWSSACNKAMREVFPSSLAQRKGKYKRTYYFGVTLLDQYQGQEEVTPADPDTQLFQSPLRDVNYDMEKIIEHLPDLLTWTGCMGTGVYRGDILLLLADKLKDQDVVNWGAQCNRAIRLVFPKVDMKRKGKFKTTMYFGVTFQLHVLKEKRDFPHFLSQFGFGEKISSTTENGLTGDESQREFTLHNLTTRQIASPDKEGQSAETETGKTVFPQWFRNEARSQMDQYLAKFGGVLNYEEGSGDGTNGEENDGDDEEDSVESAATC